MVLFPSVTAGKKAIFLVSVAGDEKEFVASFGGAVEVLAIDDQPKMSEFKAAEYDAVVGLCGEKIYNSRYLEQILNVLKPGGQCVLQAPKTANASKALMFAGLADIAATSTSDTHEQVGGKKPAWEQGDAAPLKLNVGKKAASAWTLALDDDDGDLEDEDDLLENDGVDVTALKDGYACGPAKKGAKKACKNCSCGMADELKLNEAEGSVAGVGQAVLPKSACGSCGLGDAFRCSGCPYLGQPAFIKGNVVKLSL